MGPEPLISTTNGNFPSANGSMIEPRRIPVGVSSTVVSANQAPPWARALALPSASAPTRVAAVTHPRRRSVLTRALNGAPANRMHVVHP